MDEFTTNVDWKSFHAMVLAAPPKSAWMAVASVAWAWMIEALMFDVWVAIPSATAVGDRLDQVGLELEQARLLGHFMLRIALPEGVVAHGDDDVRVAKRLERRDLSLGG